MADNDAQPTNTEEDRPAEAYLDSLDYVWDVEEFRDWDVDEEDPLAELDSEEEHGRSLVREARRWRAVAVDVDIRSGSGHMVVTEQNGTEHIVDFGGECAISGSHISLGQDEQDAAWYWVIGPSASPVRHRAGPPSLSQ
jgi:hypothetical protein